VPDMSVASKSSSEASWHRANYECLLAALDRLRLLARRRVLWLRRCWGQDPLRDYRGLVTSDAQAQWLLAGDDRGEEVAFWREDPEAAPLTQAIQSVLQDSAARTQEMAQRGIVTPLDALVSQFGLTTFERDVLLLCLAPELDTGVERLYGYIQDDVTRKFVTPHLALSLCGQDAGAWLSQRDSFLPGAPLRRFRLITLEPTADAMALRPLRLDDRMVDYLLGVNRLDERVATLLVPVPPALLAPSQRVWIDRLWTSIEAGAGDGSRPVVNLIGPPRSGKQAAARALCDRAGLDLRRLDLKRLPAAGPERQDLLRLIEREALLLQFALYVDVAAPEDSPESAAALVTPEELDFLQALLIVGSSQRWRSKHEIRFVPLRKPDTQTQRQLWREALNGAGERATSQIDALVQQFDLGPSEIAQAAAFTRAQVLLPGSADSAPDLWSVCRDQFSRDLEELTQRTWPCYGWDDIVLPGDSYRQLQEIAAQVEHRSQVYETWGFGEKLSRGRGISALFSGPSGTGKTMAAEVLAAHLQLSLYRIDLAGVVSKYIGETEKNLRRVFDAAEESGAILFFDEADALFGKRVEVRDGHDRYSNIEINYLLQRMEDYRGLAILATNKKSHLDEAFRRRLRFLVEFPFPDAGQRERIWEKSFPSAAETGGLDFTFLARLEITGANIHNIALNAAFLAAAERSPIRMDYVVLACRREYAKIDKLVTESEFGPYYAVVRK